MLSAQQVSKRYGRTIALDGFDLHAEPGEVVGLVGHNGAGKTTFVEIVAGLTRPDGGRILVDGIDVAAHPVQARRLIGLSPQEISLYPSLTVSENLRLFGGLAGLRGRSLGSAIDEAGQALGLAEVADRQVGLLSGGQRRRTQAATVLLHRPRLLLLDEPTAGADPGMRQALLNLIRRYAAAGTTVCYTTHYLSELSDLEASIAVIASGRVVARGTQRQLLSGIPDELRVALADGGERVIRTADPSRALADLLAEGHTLRSVDIRRASLDDLYHRLETDHVRA